MRPRFSHRYSLSGRTDGCTIHVPSERSAPRHCVFGVCEPTTSARHRHRASVCALKRHMRRRLSLGCSSAPHIYIVLLTHSIPAAPRVRTVPATSIPSTRVPVAHTCSHIPAVAASAVVASATEQRRIARNLFPRHPTRKHLRTFNHSQPPIALDSPSKTHPLCTAGGLRLS